MPFPRPVNGRTVRRIKPGTWNQIADLIDRDREQGTRADAMLDLRTHINRVSRRVPILIRNDSADDVDRFALMGLDNLLIGPDDGNEHEFLREVDFAANVPALHHRLFAVTEEPIRAGGTGEATLEGIVHIHALTGGAALSYVRPVPGEIYAQGSSAGPLRILAIESTADGAGLRLAKCWLSIGRQAGEVITGVLQQPLASATWSTGAGLPREGATALLRVYDIDPANELTDQARYQYEITGWTPTDPDDLEAGQSLQIDADIRYRLADNHPLHVIDSTDRDAVYSVADGWESSGNWDGTTLTIPVNETIPEVEAGDPPEPVIDGTLVLPGAPRLSATDRYELVVNRGPNTRANGAVIAAVWTGMEWLAIV